MSATNRGAARNESDFYPTPLSAFTPLIPYLPKRVAIWEPAQGDGRLVRAMKEAGLQADGQDIREAKAYDYLQDKAHKACVVTNPPFSLAQEFITNAWEHSRESFMLLRLNFLGSQKRREWWRKHEPSALFVLSQRPCFTGDGKTDATDYAWFYFSPLKWSAQWSGIIHL